MGSTNLYYQTQLSRSIPRESTSSRLCGVVLRAKVNPLVLPHASLHWKNFLDNSHVTESLDRHPSPMMTDHDKMPFPLRVLSLQIQRNFQKVQLAPRQSQFLFSLSFLVEQPDGPSEGSLFAVFFSLF